MCAWSKTHHNKSKHIKFKEMDLLLSKGIDNPRCYQCGKNLKHARKPRKDLCRPVKRSFNNVSNIDMIVSSSDSITEQEIIVSFCGMDCKSKGLKDFQNACGHLRDLKNIISKMEQDFKSGETPNSFNNYRLLLTDLSDHEYCIKTFNKSTCVHFEDKWPDEAIRRHFGAVLPWRMEISYFDDGTPEKTQYYRKSDIYEKNYLKMIIEKISYAYAVGELAHRTNSKPLHELHIAKLSDIIRSSHWGFCLMIVSIVSSLLNLDRVNEAYNIILWKTFAEVKDYWLPVFRNLSPPDWFLGTGFNEVSRKYLARERHPILPKFEEMEKIMFDDLKKDLNAIEEFHDRDEVTTGCPRSKVSKRNGYISGRKHLSYNNGKAKMC